MKLENTFCIDVPIAESWDVLLDIERVAPCVPGATLTSHDGDKYTGNIKVKLGPIALKYAGIVELRSKDEATKVAVFEGSGREARGNGTASAVITCRMSESGGKTDVVVETELDITGKPAQFGRGALAEVSNKLIGQFADNLAEQIVESAGSSPMSNPTSQDAAVDVTPTYVKVGSCTPASTPGTVSVAPPIDLLSVSGRSGAVTRLIIPAAVAALILFGLVLRRQRSTS